jgi:hypothetical protein
MVLQFFKVFSVFTAMHGKTAIRQLKEQRNAT